MDTPRTYKKLHLVLIRPSKYDDDGYVIRYWKGVLPSNTLACLHGLTEDVKSRQVLGADLKWEIDLIDETVQQVNFSRIIRASRQKDTKLVVGLVGVQSNQFARASDIAMQLRQSGIDVMIGGFHVSGILATLPNLTPELVKLKNVGVTLVAGEVEGRWEGILKDVISDQLKSIYNYIGDPPDYSNAPLPHITQKFLNRYAVSHFATLDCGRGCPYGCTFCTVINVQGRRMRFRSVEGVINLIRENYYRYKVNFYFFTDDNFSRNKNWETIFDALTELHEKEGILINFNMQVDTESYRIPNFVTKAASAGCTQVFIGMESLNEDNLKMAGKTQNRTGDFRRLVETYHEVGIATHLAYIIGFPFDEIKSVRKDIEKLQNVLCAEQASFFMLTPLPGSVDYRNMVQKGVILDADFNNYDAMHETVRHSRMTGGAWTEAYQNAWKSFYSVKNMIRILRHTNPRKYWGVFLNFIWYKNAVQVEGGHPMVHGFIRRKGRKNRRPSYPTESRWVYFNRRVLDSVNAITGWIRLALEMEEVWLATRYRSPLEERVVWEMNEWQKKAREWQSLRLSELQVLYQRAAVSLQKTAAKGMTMPPIQIPTRFELWLNKLNIFYDSLTFTRVPMKRFWKNSIIRLKKGKMFQVDYFRMVQVAIREAVLFGHFLYSLMGYKNGFNSASRTA